MRVMNKPGVGQTETAANALPKLNTPNNLKQAEINYDAINLYESLMFSKKKNTDVQRSVSPMINKSNNPPSSQEYYKYLTSSKPKWRTKRL